MWIPQSLLNLFTINKETVDALRIDVSVLRAKSEVFEHELASNKIMSDWLRMRVNQLEAERVVLMEKAYPGLHLPTPEISRISNRVKEAFDLTSLFEDQGDETTPQPLVRQ